METGRTSLKCVLPVALIFLMVPETARAQDSIAQITGGPALLSGGSGLNVAWHVGAGGETIKGAWGIGGEVDYLYMPRVRGTFDNGRGGYLSPGGHAVAVTVAGSYYPGSEVRRRAQAFVNGGFTVFAAGGVLPAMTIGAGMDWWAKPRTGLRVEVRAQLPSMMTVRCGVVFR